MMPTSLEGENVAGAASGKNLVRTASGDDGVLDAWLAIGAPALIASSCLIAAARYRRVSANKSIGSIACPPVLA